MKKILSAASLSCLLMSTSAVAWQGHFLAGGSAGYASRHGDLMLTNRVFGGPPGRPLVDEAYREQHISDNGFIWGGFLGYQMECNQYVLGLEAGIDVQDFHERRDFHLIANNAPFSTQNLGMYEYERGTAFNLSFRAGYRMLDWLMPYVRLGAQTSRDTLRLQIIVDPEDTIVPGAYSTTKAEDRKRIYRFLGGAGLEFGVPHLPQLAIRAEYNYTSKGDQISAHGQSVDTPVFGNSPLFEHSGRTKLDQHAVFGSVAWHFK